MISSATSVSMNDHIMMEGSCKIELNLYTNGPAHQRTAGGGPGSNTHLQEGLHPKRKAIDSPSDAALSCSLSGEEEDENRNNHGAEDKDQPRTSSISPTERRLLDHLSEAIRRQKDHGACMLALASRISESTIHHHRDHIVPPAKNEEDMSPMLLPNKRARYQRRNSFVIHRNPEHHGAPPPSLLQGQDLEEAMHQSVPEFYRPDPGPIQTGPQNLVSALHLQHQKNVWGNASWSNSNDTERYTFSSGSTQNKRIFPMPKMLLPQGGLSGIVGNNDLFPCPLPKT
jgi:5-methylcytosine-specific restriction endonuclease McrA